MVYRPKNMTFFQFIKIFGKFCSSGHHDIIDELLKYNADIVVPNDSEKTLMDLATQHSN